MNFQFAPPAHVYALGDVKPQVHGTMLHLQHSEQWTAPAAITSVVVYDPEFMAVHVMALVGDKDRREGWYFYHDKGGEILRLTWSKLPKCLQEIVLDRKPCYARAPGRG